MSFYRITVCRLSRISCMLLLALGATAAVADTNNNLQGDVTPLAIVPFMPAAETAPIIAMVDPTQQARIEGHGHVPVSPADSRQLAGLGSALDSSVLDNERGGSDLGPAQPLSGILTTGVVGDNRAVDVATGSNAIREGAFTNASGIPVVIQNTGANVLIQSATIVNVQLH